MVFEDNRPSLRSPRRTLSAGWTAILCVTSLLLIVGAVVALVIQHRQQVLRSSRAFSLAVTQASQAPCVKARLGAPIVANGFIVGSISDTGGPSDGGQGYADLEIPVSGSLATGKIHIVANAAGDLWTPQYLSVRTGDDRLLLLPAAPPCE